MEMAKCQLKFLQRRESACSSDCLFGSAELSELFDCRGNIICLFRVGVGGISILKTSVNA